jgi:small subunit ribosomal protein S20
VHEAVAAGDPQKAEAEMRVAAKRIDQAASKKLIHKNAAARSKSRLSKLVKTASAT